MIREEDTEQETGLYNLHYETWAHRGSVEGSEVPELAGDTVILSGTNSAGPVNPHELFSSSIAASPQSINSSRGSYADLCEMMGDLHFPAELPSSSNDRGPPPTKELPLRTASEHFGEGRASHSASWNRTISGIPRSIRRRPVPSNALIDSILTIHELPPSSAPCCPFSSVTTTVLPSYIPPIAPESSSSGSSQWRNVPRSHSYSAHRSIQGEQISISITNRHFSAPVTYSADTTTLSAERTKSWVIDAEQRAPLTPPERNSMKMSRMQSQKQMMDLLSSISS